MCNKDACELKPTTIILKQDKDETSVDISNHLKLSSIGNDAIESQTTQAKNKHSLKKIMTIKIMNHN